MCELESTAIQKMSPNPSCLTLQWLTHSLHLQGHLERCRAGPDIVADAAGDVAKPSTVILSCSDSRVPPEIICDQGLGDCHVVRYYFFLASNLSQDVFTVRAFSSSHQN